MELAPIEQAVTKMASRLGKPTPSRFVDKPVLFHGANLYLQAFFDLDSERSQGYGTVGRIPWSAIQHYVTVVGLSYEQECNLHFLIKRMDAAHMERIHAAGKRGAK